MTSKSLIRIYLTISLAAWLALLTTDLVTLSDLQDHIFYRPAYYIHLTLKSILPLSIFLAFRRIHTVAGEEPFMRTMGKTINGAVLTVGISLLLRLSKILLDFGDVWSAPADSIIYHIEQILVISYVANTFYLFKRKILYQRSKKTQDLWTVFEYGVLISILFNFTGYEISTLPFLTVLVIFSIVIIILSFNLKWVAYLNAARKWQSIFGFLIILGAVFYYESDFINEINKQEFEELGPGLFTVINFVFILIYGFFSLLVILFNLPTSSVFEQKAGEILNFQRLSEITGKGNNEGYVFDALLESLKTSNLTDAGWIEPAGASGKENGHKIGGVNRKTIGVLKARLLRFDKDALQKLNYFRNLSGKNSLGTPVKETGFNSMLIMPITSGDYRFGVIILLKKVRDGFDKESIAVVKTFVGQAGLSLENLKLIKEALEKERYVEDLKIAKEIQRSLLPKEMNVGEEYDLVTYTKSADEVGGDYYDFLKISDTKIIFAIGDVSGDGTSAAFNMAQLKGVFHSLARLNTSTSDLAAKANSALVSCFDKTSFVTVVFFIIDTKKKNIEIARAGHCPPLYVSADKSEAFFMENKGLGLGIVRTDDYANYIESKTYNYNKGDVMVLYTDGITEAKNKAGDEYGYERLKEIVMHNSLKSAADISLKIIESVHDFCEKRTPTDDHTIIVLKF